MSWCARLHRCFLIETIVSQTFCVRAMLCSTGRQVNQRMFRHRPRLKPCPNVDAYNHTSIEATFYLAAATSTWLKTTGGVCPSTRTLVCHRPPSLSRTDTGRRMPEKEIADLFRCHVQLRSTRAKQTHLIQDQSALPRGAHNSNPPCRAS